MSRMTFSRLAGIAILGGLLAAPIVVYGVGSLLTAPSPRGVGPVPTDLDAIEVSFSSESGSTISGWFGKPPPGRPVIVMSHGVHGARDQLVSRARFLRQSGFGVLLYDAQAHGESSGSTITFGFLESRDAQAAVKYVKEREPSSAIGFIGPSLAGASALLSEPPLEVDALVLEAVYPTLARAVHNRIEMRLGPILADVLSPILLWQVEPRLHFDPYRLNPVDRIPKACAPILLIAGSEDAHTTLEESKALFAAAPEPKALWIVEGAAHESFFKARPAEYRARVKAFFDRYLSDPLQRVDHCHSSAAPPGSSGFKAEIRG
jgi:uncharacterized protein